MLPTLPVLLLLAPAPSPSAFQPREDLDAGRYLKALADSEAVLGRDPGNALAWAAKSQALTALLRFREAEDAAHKALALKPDLADAHLARGMVRAGRAVQQRNLGSLRKATSAMDDFRRATELDPTLVTAWNSLGLAFQQLPALLGGSTREALRCADRLAKSAPARGALLRGMIHALDGRWREAESWLARALDIGGRDPQVIYGYLEALGQPETREALGVAAWKQRLAKDARRLAAAIPTSARGLQAVCDALLDADAGEEAWQLALAALPRCDSPSLLRLQLGKIAARAGLHRAEGLASLDRVLAEPLEGGTGGYASANWRRGQILRDLGRTREAVASAQAALNLDPKHAGARRLLSELR
jgi:tetratricopeptide (TPR) repeat protein